MYITKGVWNAPKNLIPLIFQKSGTRVGIVLFSELTGLLNCERTYPSYGRLMSNS